MHHRVKTDALNITETYYYSRNWTNKWACFKLYLHVCPVNDGDATDYENDDNRNGSNDNGSDDGDENDYDFNFAPWKRYPARAKKFSIINIQS